MRSSRPQNGDLMFLKQSFRSLSCCRKHNARWTLALVQIDAHELTENKPVLVIQRGKKERDTMLSRMCFRLLSPAVFTSQPQW